MATIAEPRADRRDYDFDEFFRRLARGRRALRRAAIFFFWLLTKPPFRPFCLLARFLASLRTKPPNRPSATACGFLPFRFFIHPLHHTTSSPSSRRTARPILLSMLIALLHYIQSKNSIALSL
jgi:hypothetical protein